MFLLYHSKGCNIYEMVLHECYVNDLHTTTCSGMLGHHIFIEIHYLHQTLCKKAFAFLSLNQTKFGAYKMW
jgi:hypothetical protein